MNLWSVNAAALFMLGYLLIGVGFLLFYLDAMLGDHSRVRQPRARARPAMAVRRRRSTGRIRRPSWRAPW